MNRKIWKALGIAVCMLALAAPRAMAETNSHYVSNNEQFADAVRTINNESKIGDKNEIVLMENITLGGNYTLTNGKTTTIKGKEGEDRKISINGSGAGITVTGEKTTLNLGVNGYDKKLTIEGDTNVAFVTVSGGATANMYGNVTLQNRGFAGNACVVIKGLKLVTGPDSAFNMYGGVIENCSCAVIAYSGATFYMQSGEIKNCKVDGDGVISVTDNSKFIMEGGTISGCKANTGGGLYADNSTINISGGTISGCTADTGGGLYAKNSSKITISGGTISGCKALSSDKGNGGGLYADSSTVTIKGGTISGCTARNNGGGLYATNSSTNSSIVNISGGMISGCTADKGGGLYADNSTVTISGGIISGCKASLGVGGGLYAENSSTITISDGTISGSTISGCEGRWGGGLYADHSTITINNGTISECKATMNNGGGLYATNSSKITINNGTISGCKAVNGHGGGLYADNSTVTISGGTISGCDGLLGGGLYAEDSSTHSSTVTITDSTISGCKAGAGGGLYVVGLTLNIKDGTISECFVSDSGKGGGLFADQSTLTISGGRIENNKAAYGGGVALRDSKVKKEDPITNWTVVGNKAYKTDTGMGYIGGGIYLESGSMDVSNGSNKIYNNTADGHGADICLTDDTSSIKLPNAANMGAKYLDSGIYIDGWYNDDNPRYTPSESGVPVKVDGAEPLKGALSLVASYKAVPVRTVTIDTNGGKGGSGSQTVQKGTTVTLEAPTKEGYLFTGWEDENKKIYPAGEDGKVNITVNENMKLTAVWEARTFTVTYVLLNGETRTETAAYGQKVTLGEEPRTGYTFVGWKDGENVYRAGETITVTGDMTLTAVWEARTFTVTYVLLNGETRAETVNYGQKVTLGEELRIGYTFVGWKDGENVYRAGETITVTGDMTLTAEWKKLPSAENLPKTGDESPVLLWGAALAVSAAACFVLRRKK